MATAHFHLVTFSALSLVLTACGGGGGGSGPTTSNIVGAGTSVPSLRSDDINGTSAIEGVGLTVRAAETFNDISEVLIETRPTGSFSHTGNVAIINDGNTSITLVPDIDLTSTFTTEAFAAETTGSTFSTSSAYDFVGFYQTEYTFQNEDYTGFGVGGFATEQTAIPTAGSATFSGDSALLTGTVNSENDILLLGDSTISADFGENTVTATLGNFQAASLSSLETVAAPVDQLVISSMTLEGNRFSGGTITSSLNGAAVELAGPNPTVSSQGQFYGQDANGAPDEVGGYVFLTDGNNLAFGYYVAD